MKKNVKTKRNLLLETNRRLQETTQELFMAKQELEKKNKELEESREREREQKKKLEQLEDAAMKRLAHLPDAQAGPGIKEEAKTSKKKITSSIAEDLSLKYINLLESYVKTKDLDKNESLVEEFCQKLIEYGITPKGIISMHLKAVPQVKTIGDLETKRITFESRMVLLKVMTSYASLLMERQ
jgi:phosphosulfolactate synthase (CoM biosynthesis protein A)